MDSLRSVCLSRTRGSEHRLAMLSILINMKDDERGISDICQAEDRMNGERNRSVEPGSLHCTAVGFLRLAPECRRDKCGAPAELAVILC